MRSLHCAGDAVLVVRHPAGTLMFASDSVLDALSAGAACDAHVAQDLVGAVAAALRVA